MHEGGVFAGHYGTSEHVQTLLFYEVTRSDGLRVVQQ